MALHSIMTHQYCKYCQAPVITLSTKQQRMLEDDLKYVDEYYDFDWCKQNYQTCTSCAWAIYEANEYYRYNEWVDDLKLYDSMQEVVDRLKRNGQLDLNYIWRN